MVNKVNVILKVSLDLANSVLITGFQGIGAVGYIATKHLIRELKAKRVGFIISKHMADIVFFEDDKVTLPYEIYYFSKEKLKIVFILNNVQPLASERIDYTKKIIEWAIENRLSAGLFIGGLDKNAKKEGEKDEYKCVPTSKYKGKIPGSIIGKELMLLGPLALLIAFSEVYEFPSLTILPYSEVLRPDPAAAAIAVKVIGDLLGVTVDVKSLYEDAKAIEEKMKKFEEFQRALEIRAKERGVSHYM